MKKINTIIFAMLCVLVGGIVLTSCDSVELKNAYVKNGTLATTVACGEELDTSKTVLVLEFTDQAKNREIAAKDLEFSEIDTQTTGQKTLTITFNEFGEDGKVTFSAHADVTITVVATEADVNSIMSLESELLRDFNYYKKERPENEKREEFKDLSQPLYVGDDNAFNFRIKASGLDGANNPVSNIMKVRTDIKIERKDGENFVELTEEALSQYVEIDTENTTLDFTEEAVGQTFRVTVKAHNRAEGYEESNTSFSTELEVVDGFNVYNAKELSVYDNTNSAYNEMKEELGIANINPKAIILQDDIQITKEDVDPNFFYDAVKDKSAIDTVKGRGVDITGTPKDKSGTGLYHRKIANGETFDFIGNYFSIDLKQFPLIVLEQEDAANGNIVVTDEEKPEYITTHLCVFYTTSKEETITEGTQVNWKNLSFIGNGALNTKPENSGAILLMKEHRVNFKAYNTIMQNFYIGYFFEMGQKDQPEGEFLVDNCKGYDAYQTLFYMWGPKHAKITNSEFIGAGGPAIIADTVNADKISNGTAGVDYYPANIDIVNSKIESEVSGQEPWFVTYNADALVSAFLTMEDQLFNDETKNAALPSSNKTIYSSFVNDGDKVVPRFNLVAIIKDGNNEGLPTGKKLSGYVRIFKTEEEYKAFYEEQKMTTYGLDLDGNNYAGGNLADLARTEQALAILQNNKNGGYISSNIAATVTSGKTPGPTDASFVYGVAKAIGFNTAFNQVATQMSQPQINCPDEEFQAKNLTNQVKNLLERFEVIAQAVQAAETQITGTGTALLEQLYQGIVAGFGSNDTLKAMGISEFKIEGWESMPLDEKIDAMKEAIEHFESDYTYATGDYLNGYLGIGMGIVVGLYDKQAA